ncbi:PREDICTED: uncharacterized protein LOC106110238 [Papilio polytes]|uniref:uncharacterized protein LOC106110238 n=1 Tax=Papilio polytes TaxID=76194 RepID=UPI000675C51D|nr:PREDICTED: uncharacterized protein LOC106110238 [Papilio polytes]
MRDQMHLREHNRGRNANQPSPPEHNIALGDLEIPPRGQEYYPPRYYQNRVILYGEPCFCPLPNLMMDFGNDHEVPPADLLLRRCIHNMLSAVCNTCVPGCYIRPY